MTSIVLTPRLPGDVWEANTFLPPVDQTTGWLDESTFTSTSPVYCVIQYRGDGLIWNGTAAVEPASGDWPSYAIATSTTNHRVFNYTVPWSQMPFGQYHLRLFRQSGSSPAASDRCVCNRYGCNADQMLPNPAGVIINSNYGGPNAMRLVDPRGEPFANARVFVTVQIPAGVVGRAEARTTPDGHWNLHGSCEPHTLHTITFTYPGFDFPPKQIMTGGPA